MVQLSVVFIIVVIDPFVIVAIIVFELGFVVAAAYTVFVALVVIVPVVFVSTVLLT